MLTGKTSWVERALAPMFEGATSLAFWLHFAVLPGLLFLVMREVFRRTHKVTADDEVVLAQRLTRACVAITLVYGGIKVSSSSTCKLL
jgi:hypothetical protein